MKSILGVAVNALLLCVMYLQHLAISFAFSSDTQQGFACGSLESYSAIVPPGSILGLPRAVCPWPVSFS